MTDAKSCNNCKYYNQEGIAKDQTCIRDWRQCAGEGYLKQTPRWAYPYGGQFEDQTLFGFYLHTPLDRPDPWNRMRVCWDNWKYEPGSYTATIDTEESVLDTPKMKEVVEEMYKRYAKNIDDEIGKILLSGGYPVIIQWLRHQMDDPLNATFVINSKDMYLDAFPQPEPEFTITPDPKPGEGQFVEIDPCEDCDTDPEGLACNTCSNPLCYEDPFNKDLIAEKDHWGTSYLEMMKKAEGRGNPLCHEDPDCENCEIDVDCGGNPEGDAVGQPSHYANAPIPSGIECWDWYELAMTEEEFAGHMKGNAFKYLFRAGRKDPAKAIEDIEKARAYLARWIKYLKGERTVHMKGNKSDAV
jgi:hypothetical protein